VEDHRRVPHFWIKVPGNPKPPKRLRDDASKVVNKHGGRLLDDELFFKPDEPTRGYGTVDCEDEEIGEIAAELGADYERVLTSNEANELADGDD
jgi:hypothetical protein